MDEVKDICKKYDNDITQFQYTKFIPNSTLELNDENQQTVFNLDFGDQFISKNIQYYIFGEFKPSDTTKSYNNDRNIKMVDNFVAHFSHRS
jgi:hypothetical protein